MTEPTGSQFGPGALVGERFRLVREIGRGGMGVVWEATHLVLEAPVAIKFLDRVGDDAAAAERLDRFRFEAQVSALLAASTKHLVAVHDAGVHAGMPYLVMELAPGRSLQDVLDEGGKVPPALALAVARQIGEALDAAHAAGVVHRDVKPANILLVEKAGAAPTAKLTDFGVAKPADGAAVPLVAPKQTAEGLVVGSPAYMSPEQIAASGVCQGASDRWSLGVVLYEALTGWLPFRGESLTEFALAISARRPDPASTVVPALPPGLDAFFDRALAKLPSERFPTCAAMADALEEALAGRGKARAAVVPGGSRGKALGAIAALGLVAGLSAWLLTAGPAAETRAAAPSAPPSAPAAPASPAPLAPTTATAVTTTAAPAPAASPSAKAPTPPTGARPTVAPAPPSAPAPPPPPGPPAPRPPRPVDPSEIH